MVNRYGAKKCKKTKKNGEFGRFGACYLYAYDLSVGVFVPHFYLIMCIGNLQGKKEIYMTSSMNGLK